MKGRVFSITSALLTSAVLAVPAFPAAQTTLATPAQAAPPADPERERIAAASEAERAREMGLLGITALTPSVSARDPSKPDFANFDEARANPFPTLPDPLTNDAGVKVTRATWPARRAEIAEQFDREVYGRVPAIVPTVTWRVAETVNETIGSTPVVTKKLVGHVDNSAAPGIAVDILMNVTTPAAKAGRHVPIVMSFGSVNPRPRPPGAPAFAPPPGPDYREQLLAKNWGFATLDTASVQADNAAGLAQGIIGLVNKGQPRSLDDWGVLRAWGWGASRGLDYLATDADVDAEKVAIFGHSRGGKAALVALAYDPRFATGFISSSGAGGAALYRRNFGEGVPNLAAANEFHWFAGNFLKYAAAGHTANEMPVDSHELIAMVAPRPLFVGGGALIMTPASAIPGDGWVDARGMFLSSAAASPVWTLLGKKGLQTTQFPPILTYLGDGDIGFRQHTEGHTPNPNWPYFIQFASKYWK
ncbi:MAG: hypothetical protein JWN66_1173 [Sphingomonas bacterium]|uniref:alpha/beta hydrolase family protein n=1 Tax=Sphingomonas bacterium TaxID=1895847 RepID=UPI002601AD9B|nr:hypothetical protein [Sphingomonas bacterium]MDB5704057.1 hypothetical protein [Sphingomonas bacterium]